METFFSDLTNEQVVDPYFVLQALEDKGSLILGTEQLNIMFTGNNHESKLFCISSLNPDYSRIFFNTQYKMSSRLSLGVVTDKEFLLSRIAFFSKKFLGFQTKTTQTKLNLFRLAKIYRSFAPSSAFVNFDQNIFSDVYEDSKGTYVYTHTFVLLSKRISRNLSHHLEKLLMCKYILNNLHLFNIPSQFSTRFNNLIPKDQIHFTQGGHYIHHLSFNLYSAEDLEFLIPLVYAIPEEYLLGSSPLYFDDSGFKIPKIPYDKDIPVIKELYTSKKKNG